MDNALLACTIDNIQLLYILYVTAVVLLLFVTANTRCFLS
jgi:hypothetical protein